MSLTECTCLMCGKRIKKLKEPYYDLRKIDAMFNTKGESPICPDCAKLIRKVRDFANPNELTINGEVLRSDVANWQSKFSDEIAKLLRTTVNTEIKLYLVKKTRAANDIYKKYMAYDRALIKACEIIKEFLKYLPEQRMDCGTATYAVDGNFLYRMPYGNPIIINEELKNISDYQQREEARIDIENNIIKAGSDKLVEFLRIDHILYFREKGSISYSTNVSGGKSGGANVKGAVIGGLLFGATGAIVGKQMGDAGKGGDIESTTVKHDDRYIVLRYINDEGKQVDKKMEYSSFEVLNSLIPEKEYSYIQLYGKNNKTGQQPVENCMPNNNTNQAQSGIPVEELKQLKELFDMGVITKEDFDAKKKQLLGI